MNTPNKLTLLRVALIPIFILFMLTDIVPYKYLWALAVFAIASFTDFLDGHLARKHGLVTDFGKLMDPLADKLLVMAAMVCLVGMGKIPIIAVVIILSREFLVTSIRLVAAGGGKVIAADKWGKYKTVSQMLWLIIEILILEPMFAFYSGLITISTILLYVTLALTVYSGYNYTISNLDIFKDC